MRWILTLMVLLLARPERRPVSLVSVDPDSRPWILPGDAEALRATDVPTAPGYGSSRP